MWQSSYAFGLLCCQHNWINYLYIVAWSDDGGYQGTVAGFTDNDTASYINSQDLARASTF
jgi:hypothetical protein